MHPTTVFNLLCGKVSCGAIMLCSQQQHNSVTKYKKMPNVVGELRVLKYCIVIKNLLKFVYGLYHK